MGGYYVPKSQRQGAQPSGFEAFMQQFLQGYAIGQQRRLQQMQEQAFTQEQAARQQQMEFHKLNLSKLKSELQLEEMLRPLKMAGALQGQPGGSMSAPPPQIFSPAGLAPGPGEAAPMALQDAGPSRSIPLPHPEIPYDFSGIGGPSGSVRPQTSEQLREQSIQDMIRKAIFESSEQVRTAGLKTRAEEEAKRAPLSFSLPGVGDVTVPGTIADQVASGAMTGLNQGRQQAFTAGENVKSRAATEEAARVEREFKAAEADKERGTKGLAGESAGRLAVSTTAKTLAEGLKKDFAALKGNRGRLARVVAGLDPDINRRIDDLVDASSRIRTGATAPESEMKSKREQILRFVDLINADTGPAQESIQRILDEALQATSAIDPGGRHSRPGVTGSANLGSPSGGNPTATNPRTGRQVQWNGSAWVPVQ